MWALLELIEAASRAGSTDIASHALAPACGTTQASGTDFGLGIEARCRALLNEGETAENLYREASCTATAWSPTTGAATAGPARPATATTWTRTPTTSQR
jgi:hypothetical protein